MQFNLSRWVNKLTLAFFYRFLFCLYPHSYKFISLDTLKWRPRRNGKSLWEKWRKIWSFWWLRWSFLPLKNFLSSSQRCSVALLLQEQVQRIVFATILQEHKCCIFSELCGKLYIVHYLLMFLCTFSFGKRIIGISKDYTFSKYLTNSSFQCGQ